MLPTPAQAQNDAPGLGRSFSSPRSLRLRAPQMIPPPSELIFPQSNVATMPSGRSLSREPIPMGPSSGAGLGYGPIHPGDIVEVQIFGSPEYSVRMPVSGSGDIAIPYAGLFHVAGMTSIEAAKAIAKLFEDLQNPARSSCDRHHSTIRLQRHRARRGSQSRNLSTGRPAAAHRYTHRNRGPDGPGRTCHRDLRRRLHEEPKHVFVGSDVARK